jgi:hypothetical protein
MWDVYAWVVVYCGLSFPFLCCFCNRTVFKLLDGDADGRMGTNEIVIAGPITTGSIQIEDKNNSTEPKLVSQV